MSKVLEDYNKNQTYHLRNVILLHIRGECYYQIRTEILFEQYISKLIEAQVWVEHIFHSKPNPSTVLFTLKRSMYEKLDQRVTAVRHMANETWTSLSSKMVKI